MDPHRNFQLVAAIIQAVQDVNVEVIRDIETNSQTLDRIADSFSQILDRRTFTVFSFEKNWQCGEGRRCVGYMTTTTRVLYFVADQVAELASILIGDAHERRDTIHANHVDMAKFSDATDDGYIKVLYAIKMLLKEKRRWICDVRLRCFLR